MCVSVHPLLTSSRLYDAAQGVSIAAVCPVVGSWMRYLGKDGEGKGGRCGKGVCAMVRTSARSCRIT
jgi:hypothetical protein